MIIFDQLVEPNCPSCGLPMNYRGETLYEVCFYCFRDGTEIWLDQEPKPDWFVLPSLGSDSRMAWALGDAGEEA